MNDHVAPCRNCLCFFLVLVEIFPLVNMLLLLSVQFLIVTCTKYGNNTVISILHVYICTCTNNASNVCILLQVPPSPRHHLSPPTLPHTHLPPPTLHTCNEGKRGRREVTTSNYCLQVKKETVFMSQETAAKYSFNSQNNIQL